MRLKDLVTAARAGTADWMSPAPEAPGISSTNAAPNESAGTTTTNLRSLSPLYREEEHGGYVQVLTTELTKKGDEAPLNVALTGHYGSGKSSVLIETRRRLVERHGLKVINLSLPSLGAGDGRIPQDGDPGIDKTNLIQKEIVKQLLYRRRPADTPASRYSRLDTFNVRAAAKHGALLGLFVTFLALLAGLPDRVQSSVPEIAWEWTDEHLFSHAAITLQWLSLALAFVIAMFIAVWLQRILQQRLRVTELAAGAGQTKVTLSEPTSSYFDEYLDEIVYFFQTSKTRLVIFEDLDRFKDPHIFEALRELNLLLNNAEQTGPVPIRFVYAIRDSIFEQLNRKPVKDSNSNPETNEGSDAASRSEKRRLITTNRTKFFDLVVPVVPFISHRTSRELMNSELKAIPARQRPSREVVDLVSAHITDMRLIKNICNEFDVFRTRILREEGLKELTADKLFASIVYKNLFLIDYEDIRNGTSLLDDMYKAYRQWVTERTASARSTERKIRFDLRRLDSVASRSTRLGARLQDVLVSRVATQHDSSQIQVNAAGRRFAWAELKTVQFWQSYLENEGDLQVTSPNPYSVTLSFEKVQSLIGERLDIDDWARGDRQDLLDRISRASSEQLRFSHASLQAAVCATGDLLRYDNEDVPLADVAMRIFDGSQVVVDLIREGYIDENFTLYVTQFPGESSASAMNFIIKSVQPNVMDIEYHFGAGDEVDAADIEAALASESSRILNGESIYNRELFDYLLPRNPDKLHEPIRRLAARADEDLDFIDAYVGSGKHVGEFIEILSARWPGIFDYLLGTDPEAADEEVLNAALHGVGSTLTYQLAETQRDAIVEALRKRRLTTITTSQPLARSKTIAAALNKMDVVVPKLDVVAEPLQTELVARSLYSITRDNLRALLGEVERFALDSIEDQGPECVYTHLLANLPAYIKVIVVEPATPSVLQPERFAGILRDVHAADTDLVESIATLAAPDCALRAHDDVNADLWPAIVRAGRFANTASSLGAYIAQYGVDEDLRSYLDSLERIEGDQDEYDHIELALVLLNAATLKDDLKLRLIEGLDLTAESIIPSRITAEGHSLIPELVRHGMIADDADAFDALDEDNYAVKSALVSASSEFGTYMTSLSLSTSDLHVLSWEATPDAVKRQVLDNMDTFGQALGPKGATSFVVWAARQDCSLSASTIEVLAARAGTSAAVATVKLLGAHAAEIEIELLKRILNSLGGKYAQLTSPGRDLPKVPELEGMDAILRRLQSVGIVSKIQPDSKKKTIRVSKHHS
ncbi:YobI family P-loop NTPase [Arthrobacter pigmenti]